MMIRMLDFIRHNDTFIGETGFGGKMRMIMMMMTMMAVNKLWDIWFSMMTFMMAMVNVSLMR